VPEALTEVLTTDNLVALLTLTLLEVVLGIDNIVFISILTGKLPKEQRPRAWRIGLSLAMLMRIGLLLSLSWVMGLTSPLMNLLGQDISGRDLILLLGGLFLVGKATWEIHDKLEGGGEHGPGRAAASFASVLAQILVLDLVFSLDSVITAVGMASHVYVMIAAVVIAIAVMLVFAQAIGAFVERHPTIKMLALSFLILIGVLLIADGLGKHIPKGYVYFAMAFSLGVEMLNLRLRKKSGHVEFKRPSVPEPPKDG
jgi:predicted tellurium resistance membrane protein TerC